MGKILIIPIWTALAAAALVSAPAHATSFASFSVPRQVEESGYVVRGRIGATSVRTAAGNRPYTYWGLTVEESFSDAKLSGEIEIRQPGGEANGYGYRVAGAADFRAGEDVIVFLRDTEESAKEVVGLQSGKYNLVTGLNGDLVLKNGLGVIPKGPKGGELDLDAFRALVQRVNSKDLTDDDRKVMVDVAGIHRHGGADHEHGSGGAGGDAAKTAVAGTVSVPSADKTASLREKPVEDPAADADRQVASQSGPAWIGFVVAGIFLVCAALLIRLLTRKPTG